MTPDDINKQCTAQLKEAGLNDYVAVIGSGPSIPFLGSIEDLQQKLREKCGVEKDPGTGFCASCEAAFRKDEIRYYNTIRDIFSVDLNEKDNSYRYIVNMPFRGFVTLNYDPILPWEFQKYHSGNFLFTAYQSALHYMPQEFLSTPQRLVAIHGCFDVDGNDWEKSIILKESDYKKHYEIPPAPLFGWWVELLLTVPCLFIGTSLHEPGISCVIDYLWKYHRKRLLGNKHLHLVDCSSNNTDEKSLRAIDRIFYHRVDPAFSGLNNVLRPLADMRIVMPKPSGFVPKLFPKPFTSGDPQWA